ncbi:hypothetical protein [Microbacterium sp. A94]|uniref:hypothetical protein n=1 Tax=Microbacterium sp. A94 TaxID=3450717 RepID=UPI003F42C9C1
MGMNDNDPVVSSNQLVRDLTDSLGPTLVAALAGVGRAEVNEWAAGPGTEPSVEIQRRLTVAHEVWADVSESDGASVARGWFIGGNPWLYEQTPVSAIREDRHAEVRRAAVAFVDGDVDQ